MRLDLKWELDNECPDRCLCMFDGDRYTFPSVRSTPLRLSVKPPTKSNSVHEDSTLQRTARSWHARIPFLRVDHIVFSCPDGPRQDITTLCPGSVASLAGFQATTYGRFSGDHRGIDSFRGKVLSKADNTMGIMVSISGYSTVAVSEASRDKTPLLLLDHRHLYFMLTGSIQCAELIARIRRHSSQTGEAYLS